MGSTETPVKDDTFLAKELFNERKFEKAYKLSVEKADGNDPGIIYNLGFMHYFGKGVKRDRKKGMLLVKKSYEKGCKYADRVYSWMIFDVRDRKLGFFSGTVAGIAAAFFFAMWKFKDSRPVAIHSLFGMLACFIASYFVFSNIVSILWCGVNLRFEDMAGRAGKFLFSMIGGIAGSGIIFFAVMLFFFFVKVSRDTGVAVGTAAIIIGALAGFRIGGSVGSCIGESAAQSLAYREKQ